jgi:hypothetical protein
MRQIQSVRNVFSKFSALSWLLLIAVIWLIAATFFWWRIVYASPKHTFEGMLKNNFSTVGYSRSSNSDQQGLTAKEMTQLQLGKDTMLRTRTSLKQQSDLVVTDAISSQDKEYVRYVQIKTNTKDANGKTIDFSKALNTWASSPSNGSSQSISKAILGIFPIGNISSEDRSKILGDMKKNNVFSVNYKTVKKETEQGRQVYTYDVQLLPQPYIAMLKEFGTAVGLGSQVASLNPSDYASAQPTSLKVKVDVASRHIRSVSYAGTANRTENYTGYGVVSNISLPDKTITMEELQKRLSTQ